MHKNETRLLSYTIHTTKFKMGERERTANMAEKEGDQYFLRLPNKEGLEPKDFYPKNLGGKETESTREKLGQLERP